MYSCLLAWGDGLRKEKSLSRKYLYMPVRHRLNEDEEDFSCDYSRLTMPDWIGLWIMPFSGQQMDFSAEEGSQVMRWKRNLINSFRHTRLQGASGLISKRKADSCLSRWEIMWVPWSYVVTRCSDARHRAAESRTAIGVQKCVLEQCWSDYSSWTLLQNLSHSYWYCHFLESKVLKLLYEILNQNETSIWTAHQTHFDAMSVKLTKARLEMKMLQASSTHIRKLW